MDKALLEKMYLENGASLAEIAHTLQCSAHKVAYWMYKHEIPRRSISEAVYQKNHPDGDPFTEKPIETIEEAWLQGLGIGLYWGEGTKASKHSVRLGNTDPVLIKSFMDFLIKLYGVERKDFRFGLQIFTDINPDDALQYWTMQLDVSPSQFSKIVVTISGSLGTYRKKSKYGVTTVYYHNTKLRDKIVGLLPR